MRAIPGLAVVLVATLPAAGSPAAVADRYRPALRPPEVLEPFLPYLAPGADAFADEKEAAALGARLRELGAGLREDPRRAADVASLLLAPAFRGTRLEPLEETSVARHPSLEIARSTTLSTEPSLDARAFAEELHRLVAGFRAVTVAEFLITTIEVDREQGLARTDVRYDLVGPGRDAWRVGRSGQWRMRWTRAGDGWRVSGWSATRALRSSAASPVFAEVTGAALGGNESFRRQLLADLDAWVATMDSAIARDSNAHHGVSVGDADGDGLDDLYVAQPSGLPNRLYRNRGDGTFEDATEKANLAVLDDTAHSLFADVDNDGDQDLVLGLSAGPALFVNDGAGRFALVPDGFRFAEGLQGWPMSMAMADYDRDGFLDLYLAVYSFYSGAARTRRARPCPTTTPATARRARCSATTAGGVSWK